MIWGNYACRSVVSRKPVRVLINAAIPLLKLDKLLRLQTHIDGESKIKRLDHVDRSILELVQRFGFSRAAG